MGKRRGQGEGTIIKRRDDRYEVRISIDGRQRTIGYAATAEEAQRIKTAALRERDRGVPFISEKQTLEEFVEYWLPVKTDLKESTRTRYENLLKVHILPTLGKVPLTKITPQQVQRLYASRRGAEITGKHHQRVGPTTVLRVHTLLHGVLEAARRENLVAINVCDNVTAPRPARREMHTLSRDEVAAFLDAAHGERLEALFILDLATGMRQGEALALRWCDVDLNTGKVRIRATLYRRKAGDFAFTATKTRESDRTLLLPPSAVEALRAHRIRQNEERLRLGEIWQDNDLVFCAEDGSPLDGQSVTRYHFRRVLRRAGLSSMRFHELRHTYATLMNEAGMDIKKVSATLGHSTTAITADLYTHHTTEGQRQVADVAEAIVTGGRQSSVNPNFDTKSSVNGGGR